MTHTKLTIEAFQKAAELLHKSAPEKIKERQLFVSKSMFKVGLEAAKRNEPGFSLVGDKPHFLGAEIIRL